MILELQCLIFVSLLFLIAFVPVSYGKMLAFGPRWLASNRKPLPGKELSEWAQRCERAHQNLKDNFPAFIVAILALAYVQKFDSTTSVLAAVYAVARLGHYISYALGNVPARFVFYSAGLFCNTYLLIKVLL